MLHVKTIIKIFQILGVLGGLDESYSTFDTESSSSSSSSSSDESIRKEHVKVTNFVNTIDQFDNDFKAHMRLTRDTVNYLISKLSVLREM